MSDQTWLFRQGDLILGIHEQTEQQANRLDFRKIKKPAVFSQFKRNFSLK